MYIEKEDGRQRPLGVAALEDKIVQQAVVIILNQIYEEDFLGFSYGFRPGRSIVHDQSHRFDTEDLRVMNNLGTFACKSLPCAPVRAGFGSSRSLFCCLQQCP